MIWPLPGAVAVTAWIERTLRVSWQSTLQLSSGNQEVHSALATTGTGPEALQDSHKASGHKAWGLEGTQLAGKKKRTHFTETDSRVPP